MLTNSDGTTQTRKGAAALNTSTGATIATLLCLAISFFLLAATIVLALIPVYLPTNTVPLTSTRSKLITLLTSVQSNPSGRKRTLGDLDGYVGNSFGDSGKQSVRSQLKTYLTSAYASDLIVDSCIFVISNTTSKSLPVVKRQNLGIEVFLLCGVYVIYSSSCVADCQTLHAADIKTSLNTGSSALDLSSIPVFASNGTQVATIPRVKAIRVAFISDVVPGTSGNTAAPTPGIATVITIVSNVTTTTTTPAATPSIG